MDISCDIIRDLLPLYAEDLVSEDSRKLVDDHLCTCDPCTKQLGILKKAAALPIEVETRSLKRVEHIIRRRRVLAIAAVLMTVASLIVTGMTWLMTPYSLTAEEAIEGVELREDGGFAIDYASGITGTAGRAIFDTDNWGMISHTNRYDWYQAKQRDKLTEGMNREELEVYIAEKYGKVKCTQKEWDRFHNISVDYGAFETKDGTKTHLYDPETWTEENGKVVYHPTDRNQWYLNSVTGDGEVLLWDSGKPMPTSIIWRSTYAYGYVFWGCLIFAVISFVISRDITGIWKKVLSRVPLVLVCTAASILLVTNGELRTLEYYLSAEWNEAICLEALVLSLAAICWHQLHLLNRQDRGME